MAGPRLTGPRLTGPVKRLARSITTTHSGVVPQATTLITSSRAAAPLSHKYAELLKERHHEGDHSRHIYTRSANRPHPAPRRMRLMQTFTSSASRPAPSDPSSIDFMVLPGLQEAHSDSTAGLRVPILPDNYLVHHATPEVVSEPVLQGQINVIAANPENVSVAALTEVEGMTLDGVELKWAHENEKQEPEQGMLKDLWKGLVDDVFGGASKGKLAV
ncbi:hypothetical protein BKA67DRAFT_657632 [Truncatella angustata]|uniref:Uncharacterized protein n=1 Tax=Truncatella angustata TaxID=152316 RepID=A0A9P8UN28_9PEZI|nr:uncharacterized protein BKA67DRAFT_657632 [Truncatella angustata]KAH6655709.1 hypothetical protein BKA67DRAFT_657632 [Truncatella angustata]KAH8201896.1 hypothetical protein TruAng_003888 [Truncatella angustata]